MPERPTEGGHMGLFIQIQHHQLSSLDSCPDMRLLLFDQFDILTGSKPTKTERFKDDSASHWRKVKKTREEMLFCCCTDKHAPLVHIWRRNHHLNIPLYFRFAHLFLHKLHRLVGVHQTVRFKDSAEENSTLKNKTAHDDLNWLKTLKGVDLNQMECFLK